MFTLRFRHLPAVRPRFPVGILVCLCVLGPVLAAYGQTDRLSQLISQLKDPDSTKRYLAAKGLADTKDPRAVEPLIAALKDTDSFVRYCVVSALGDIKDPRAVEPLTAALKDTDSYVRSGAAKALDDIKNAHAAEPLSAAPEPATKAHKNYENDWSVISNVSGSHGELIGQVYAAPKSRLVIEDGKISHGAGKFVAETDEKEVIACSVIGDKLIDFVALEVSELSWTAFGDPVEITLRKPSVTYHLTADKSDNLVEQKLLVDGKYPGFNIVKKTDAVVLNEIAGKVDPTPNMYVSFAIKTGDKSIRKNIGLFLRFNGCKVAGSMPPSTTASPKTTPKPIPHQP